MPMPYPGTSAKRMKVTPTYRKPYKSMLYREVDAPTFTGRRGGAYTTQSATGGGFYFNNRPKLNRRAYRNKLWDSTTDKPHFRSSAMSATSGTTGVTQGNGPVGRADLTWIGSDAFWTTAGGALDPDGGTVPTFKDDLTVRGGLMTATLSCPPSVSDVLLARMWIIKTVDNPNFTNVPSTATISWDPTLIQEFNTRVGRIKMYKEFLLGPGDAGRIEFKHPIQKYDQTASNTNVSRRYQCIYHISNLTSTSDAAYDFVKGHNLSFTGDAQ